MKRESETISVESMNEYLRIRAEQYIEKRKKGFTKDQEIEFYSNLMEIVSIIDYTGCTMTISNSELIKRIRNYHFWNELMKAY